MSSLPGTASSLLAGANITSSPGSGSAWRPPQWSATNQQPPLILTANNPQTNQSTMYVFDAILNAEHEQQAVVTLNPVQTGAAITDNAYVVPPRLTVEIRMSDAMQAFTLGQFSSAPSKSVSAFQTLVNLQGTCTPVQIVTRLRPYSNMMITSIRAEDRPETKYGLRAWVTFTQILMATVAITAIGGTNNPNTNSELPQVTGGPNTGQLQATQVTPAIQQQNNILSRPLADLQTQ